jgi:hypothetical protein
MKAMMIVVCTVTSTLTLMKNRSVIYLVIVE